MIEFRRFGRAAIVVTKIFGCLEEEDGSSIAVYSDRGTVMYLSGEESRAFIRFREECIAEDCAPRSVIVPAESAPRPAQEVRERIS